MCVLSIIMSALFCAHKESTYSRLWMQRMWAETTVKFDVDKVPEFNLDNSQDQIV